MNKEAARDKASLSTLRNQLERARKMFPVLDRLIDYARHEPDCAIEDGDKCSCGLEGLFVTAEGFREGGDE